MNNINALIEHIFDWRSTASRREFLSIFLAICGAGLLLSIPYIYLITEFLALVIDYGEDAAGMMFRELFDTDSVFYGMLLWSFLVLAFWTATLFISTFSFIRRLNDIHLSRWWLLLGFLPITRPFFVIFLLLTPTKTS